MEVSQKSDAVTLQFLWSSALKLREHDQKNLLPIVSQLRESCMTFAKAGAHCSSFNTSEVCEYCGSPWSEGSFRLKILHHSRKMKKLRKRCSSPSSSSSKFKKNLSELFAKCKDNVMARKCNICGKIQKIGLRKPQVPKTDTTEPSVNESSIVEKKKRKRKSKKDRFSGLHPSAVVNARLSLCSRDSLSVDTSSSIGNSESILSDTTFRSDGNLESVCESNKTDRSSNNISSTDFSPLLNNDSAKKLKLVHDSSSKKQNKKKNRKKKKKSLVSDFLNSL